MHCIVDRRSDYVPDPRLQKYRRNQIEKLVSNGYKVGMARPRKRHVQQDLFPRRGGKRPGAGRKPKGARAGSRHKKRPVLKPYWPVHIVLRVAPDVGSLRKRLMYRALREATIALAKRELSWDETGAFRIVHISIQKTHVHLLVEAAHRTALSRGMQAFQISAAKHINGVVSMRRGERRRGSVFPDRFHQTIIKSPRQARRALAYVLNNWRKHREDHAQLARNWKVDPFSSALCFADWKERAEPYLGDHPASYAPLLVYLPRTWLLKVGWKQKHPLISLYEVPSQPI
jgi:REP element-mobilizing transposase RayT